LTDLCAEDLATIYAQPSPRVIAKARPAIDAHAKKFIEMSPFCVLATSGADGSVDASPRGGSIGFVHVDGPNQLLMPDRSGNNRIDSFRNVVEGSGFVHLLFFVPGIDETLRVGGRGTLFGRSGPARLHGGIRQAAARGAEHRRQRSLFPLRQGADALEAVGAGEGAALGDAEHRRGHS
jgi:predicted pyridoxine 5'-phosphate oxidase superfamily flavin-nucleotide-binding protein